MSPRQDYRAAARYLIGLAARHPLDYAKAEDDLARRWAWVLRRWRIRRAVRAALLAAGALTMALAPFALVAWALWLT